MRSLVLTLLGLALCSAADAPYVWVEAESAGSETNLTDGHPNVSKHKALSGGVSIGANPKSTETRYWRQTITVPAEGTWHLYVRKFWKHGPFKWRFDDQPWTDLTKDGTVLLDSEGLGQQHQTISWVGLGKVTLSKGEHRLEVEGLEAGGAFVLDCFVLTPTPFDPMGLRKPGEKLGLADPGTWAFEPDLDAHNAAPVIDLRGLNEKVAGERGWVKRSADGADFVDGSGKPIRFWSVNTYIHRTNDLEAVKRQAANFAKRGVNMVRLHGHFAPGKGSKLSDVDEQALDQCRLLVAGMKQSGIYTTVSPYWGTHTDVEASWNYTKGTGGKMTAVLFFDEELQEAYKQWWRRLLTEKNPYTGIPLKDDPALAILQLQNEDSMLFHTMSRLGPEATKLLEGKYAAWLKQKGRNTPAKLIPIWKLGEDPGKDDDQAKADLVEFYAETMHGFNAMMVQFFKDLGCKQLVNAGNWKPGDITKLGDAERWSYTAADIIGVNRYVNGGTTQGGHVDPSGQGRSGYQINVGDLYADESATVFPRKIAYNLKQVAGYPMMVYESCWVPPMSKQSEGPFLIAAYGSLSGVDSLYWFCTSEEAFASRMGKWQIADPMQLGSFPAASWMFRTGLIKQGEVAVHEERSLGSIWKREHPIISEDMGFDPNRDAAFGAKEAAVTAVDPKAFLVGPVHVVYDGDPAKSTTVDLSKYIQGDRITSITGELVMDTKVGVCTLKAPGAQGATGSLKAAGSIDCGTVTIRSGNDYASVLCVALDGKPLDTSKKVFVQVTTRARPHGWKHQAGTFPVTNGKAKGEFTGFKITSVGGAPWNIDLGKVELVLKNKGLTKARRVDANLYAGEAVPVANAGGTATVTVPEDCLYLILE